MSGENTLSNGARDLLDLQRRTDELLADHYEDKKGAHEKLSQLDEAGQERLRNDPAEIGELRDGVDPNSVDTESLSTASHVYEGVKPEYRQELKGFDEARDQAISQNREVRSQEEAKAYSDSPEGKANEALKGAVGGYNISI